MAALTPKSGIKKRFNITFNITAHNKGTNHKPLVINISIHPKTLIINITYSVKAPTMANSEEL